jgi:hypothetical protein
MKFYTDIIIYKFYYYYITSGKLTCIHFDKLYDSVVFYKNGKKNNCKNASYIGNTGYKQFCLNNKIYGNQNNFTKQTWRKFVKLQAFL